MTSFPPERFRGDLEGWLAWAAANWETGAGWCPRHWAPVPVEGLNGLLASTWLLEEGLKLAPRSVRRAKGKPAVRLLNDWLASLGRPLCCELGDERVDQLWKRVKAAP